MAFHGFPVYFWPDGVSLLFKINEDFTEFFDQIKILMSENKYEEAKDALLEFISTNPKETMAINQYLDCLIELKQFEEVDTFIQSLEKDVKDTEESHLNGSESDSYSEDTEESRLNRSEADSYSEDPSHVPSDAGNQELISGNESDLSDDYTLEHTHV